jgi:phenylalanyl-tRNA synthetase beta chain
VDVIEDILRIYGYNNVDISNSLKANLSAQTLSDRKQKMQTLISEQLTANGFNEILNNSLTKKGYYESLETYPAANCVPLVNPLSNDLNVMRQTLLFGGLESIAYNRNRKNGDLRFYEFGNCYFFNETKKSDDKILAPYSEEFHIGLWICGKRTHKNWATAGEQSSVFELKAHVENILKRMGINSNQVFFETETNELLSVGMSVRTHTRSIGFFGIVSPAICKKFDIDTETFFAEMNWDILMKESEKQSVSFSEIARFPAVSRDLALLIDKQLTFNQIRQIALGAEKKLLKKISLFDVYEGKNLPEGKKSYAVNFLLQDEEKTLNDKQIDNVMLRIRKRLETELGAQLR